MYFLLINFLDSEKTAFDLKEKIKAQIEYARNEIEIRVESLKIELDEIHQIFQAQLNEYENNLIK